MLKPTSFSINFGCSNSTRVTVSFLFFFFFVELGSDFLLDTREQKLAQNLMILTQVQMCFSTEKSYKDKAVLKKKIK